MILYRAGWVLPVTSPPIRDGIVAVDDGLIAYVGNDAGAPTGELRDLGNVLLMPGLVNAHTHLELTALRGLIEEPDFHLWIRSLISAKRECLTPVRMLAAARQGIAEGLRAGITTYGDTCDSGVSLEAMSSMGVRGIMYQEVFGPAPEQRDESLAQLRSRLDSLLPLATPLVGVGVSPHAPYSVSLPLFTAVAALAREGALPMAIHIAESSAEMSFVTEGEGPFAESHRARGIHVAPRARSPIAMLHEAGVMAARPLLIHAVHADAADIALAAASRCPVAHCPVSNSKLGHGVAPLVEMLDAGIVVGMGSDSMASNNRMDILEETRLAVLLQRSRPGARRVLTAEQGLALATLGGARALGLGDITGSLETGKAADLAAFDASRCGHVSGDPAAVALFALTGRDAVFVAVAGRELVRDGQLREDITGSLRHDPLEADSLARWHAARH